MGEDRSRSLGITEVQLFRQFAENRAWRSSVPFLERKPRIPRSRSWVPWLCTHGRRQFPLTSLVLASRHLVWNGSEGAEAEIGCRIGSPGLTAVYFKSPSFTYNPQIPDAPVVSSPEPFFMSYLPEYGIGGGSYPNQTRGCSKSYVTHLITPVITPCMHEDKDNGIISWRQLLYSTVSELAQLGESSACSVAITRQGSDFEV